MSTSKKAPVTNDHLALFGDSTSLKRQEMIVRFLTNRTTAKAKQLAEKRAKKEKSMFGMSTNGVVFIPKAPTTTTALASSSVGSKPKTPAAKSAQGPQHQNQEEASSSHHHHHHQTPPHGSPRSVHFSPTSSPQHHREEAASSAHSSDSRAAQEKDETDEVPHKLPTVDRGKSEAEATGDPTSRRHGIHLSPEEEVAVEEVFRREIAEQTALAEEAEETARSQAHAARRRSGGPMGGPGAEGGLFAGFNADTVTQTQVQGNDEDNQKLPGEEDEPTLDLTVNKLRWLLQELSVFFHTYQDLVVHCNLLCDSPIVVPPLKPGSGGAGEMPALPKKSDYDFQDVHIFNQHMEQYKAVYKEKREEQLMTLPIKVTIDEFKALVGRPLDHPDTAAVADLTPVPPTSSLRGSSKTATTADALMVKQSLQRLFAGTNGNDKPIADKDEVKASVLQEAFGKLGLPQGSCQLGQWDNPLDAVLLDDDDAQEAARLKNAEAQGKLKKINVEQWNLVVTQALQTTGAMENDKKEADFFPAARWQGKRKGYFFGKSFLGQGYYKDKASIERQAAKLAELAAKRGSVRPNQSQSVRPDMLDDPTEDQADLRAAAAAAEVDDDSPTHRQTTAVEEGDELSMLFDAVAKQKAKTAPKKEAPKPSTAESTPRVAPQPKPTSLTLGAPAVADQAATPKGGKPKSEQDRKAKEINDALRAKTLGVNLDEIQANKLPSQWFYGCSVFNPTPTPPTLPRARMKEKEAAARRSETPSGAGSAVQTTREPRASASFTAFEDPPQGDGTPYQHVNTAAPAHGAPNANMNRRVSSKFHEMLRRTRSVSEEDNMTFLTPFERVMVKDERSLFKAMLFVATRYVIHLRTTKSLTSFQAAVMPGVGDKEVAKARLDVLKDPVWRQWREKCQGAEGGAGGEDPKEEDILTRDVESMLADLDHVLITLGVNPKDPFGELKLQNLAAQGGGERPQSPGGKNLAASMEEGDLGTSMFLDEDEEELMTLEAVTKLILARLDHLQLIRQSAGEATFKKSSAQTNLEGEDTDEEEEEEEEGDAVIPKSTGKQSTAAAKPLPLLKDGTLDTFKCGLIVPSVRAPATKKSKRQQATAAAAAAQYAVSKRRQAAGLTSEWSGNAPGNVVAFAGPVFPSFATSDNNDSQGLLGDEGTVPNFSLASGASVTSAEDSPGREDREPAAGDDTPGQEEKEEGVAGDSDEKKEERPPSKTGSRSLEQSRSVDAMSATAEALTTSPSCHSPLPPELQEGGAGVTVHGETNVPPASGASGPLVEEGQLNEDMQQPPPPHHGVDDDDDTVATGGFAATVTTIQTMLLTNPGLASIVREEKNGSSGGSPQVGPSPLGSSPLPGTPTPPGSATTPGAVTPAYSSIAARTPTALSRKKSRTGPMVGIPLAEKRTLVPPTGNVGGSGGILGQRTSLLDAVPIDNLEFPVHRYKKTKQATDFNNMWVAPVAAPSPPKKPVRPPVVLAPPPTCAYIVGSLPRAGLRRTRSSIVHNKPTTPITQGAPGRTAMSSKTKGK